MKKKDIRANLGNITRSISYSNPQLYSNYARKEIDLDFKPHEPKIIGKKFFDGLTAYTLVAEFELDKDEKLLNYKRQLIMSQLKNIATICGLEKAGMI